MQRGPRSLRVEPFEERTLFAVGPQLVAVIPSESTLLNPDQILHTAPTELTFRFSTNIAAGSLTTNNIASIQITRGGDHILGNGNDITVNVPHVGLSTIGTDVVVRFANPLVDDLYQIRIVGTGANPLRDTLGNAFNNGQDLTQRFTLDLGAQVVAVVPQPVTRNNTTNALTQASNQIEVWFNVQDPLDATTATNRFNYELIRTAQTASTGDDTLIVPTAVTYDVATGKAVLTFGGGELAVPGVYRLRIGNNDPMPLAPVTPTIGTAGSSFGTAADLGAVFPIAQGTQNLNISGNIARQPRDGRLPGRPRRSGLPQRSRRKPSAGRHGHQRRDPGHSIQLQERHRQRAGLARHQQHHPRPEAARPRSFRLLRAVSGRRVRRDALVRLDHCHGRPACRRPQCRARGPWAVSPAAAWPS